jgi:hypothetical protein
VQRLARQDAALGLKLYEAISQELAVETVSRTFTKVRQLGIIDLARVLDIDAAGQADAQASSAGAARSTTS